MRCFAESSDIEPDDPPGTPKYETLTELQISDNINVIERDKQGFLASGRDYEPVYVSHRYTQEEQQILSSYESNDYLPSNNEIYRSWLKSKAQYRFEYDRWLMMSLIGFIVGLIGFLLHQTIELIFEWKLTFTNMFLEKNQFAVAWSVSLAYSLLFIIIATSLVVYVRPSASGSGIPELIGFLNGTVIRHIFNVKTMVVKFLSCVCAIGAGLPLGSEGPMIHLGSLVGAGVSQFRSETLGINLPFFSRFRNPEDKRNFISAGAAAGVASAFGAPVGGLLFSMEEVSSFWDVKLTWQTFFCCMIATFTTDLFNSVFIAFRYTGSFGRFIRERYIIFNISAVMDANILLFIPTLFIGLIGGVLGALFIFSTLKITRLRMSVLNHLAKKSIRIQKLFQLFEPIVLMIIVTSFVLYIPQFSSCSSFVCSNSSHDHVTYDCYNDSRTRLHTETSVAIFTCPPGETWRSDDQPERWLTNKTYSELATLLLSTSEEAVKHLLSHDTHLQFGYSTLLIVLAFEYISVLWVSGVSLSSGILVPMLYIGALYGRLVGIAMIKMFGVYTESDSYWSWIDPGAFAVIGAASFIGGVSRLTLAITVIMLELTNDVQFLLPIMVAVLISKWVGDCFTHPLYHALLELRCIPFLDQDPTTITIDKKHTISLELFTVKDVMASPVVMFNHTEMISNVAKTLLETNHSGFPVTKVVNNTPVFQGLITRSELYVILRHDLEYYDEIEPRFTGSLSKLNYTQFLSERLLDPDIGKPIFRLISDDDELAHVYISLERFVNRSAVTVPSDFSLHRAYIIFRSLGLRHLTVVNDINQVIGIITRKDLMGFRLQSKIEDLMQSLNLYIL